MIDRDKVISAFSCLANGNGRECLMFPCPYGFYGYLDCDRSQIMLDAIAMLKEQEAVKPVLDEQTGRIWLCGKCGSYVGFEDNDPHDPNEFDKYCRECGRPVLWAGR